MNKIEPSCISIVLSDNLRMVKEQFHSSDLKIRTFNIGGECRESAIIFLDGITNIENVQENIFKPLIQKNIESIESVVSNNLYVLDVTITTKFDDTLTGLSKGQTLILIDGFHKGILADSSDWQKKAVSEPIAERSAKGPSIGFNELLKVNVNLIRHMVQCTKVNNRIVTGRFDSKNRSRYIVNGWTC
ncbi:hypothetical protein F4694_003760 [Bacillus niacini]|uniref:Spore germination protein n=1 Tax=Neobacillus niacini TaxID=86668 RepID=A0A852TFY4_9BACI|nr:spore germination protein [Neobacillus niacini]NYE06975.1 hypothetical protein [Neobacillus niacini]